MFGWQAVALALLSLPWLLIAAGGIGGLFDPTLLEPGETTDGVVLTAVMGLVAAVLVLVIMSRTFVVLRADGIWVGGKVVPYERIVAVEVEPDDGWLLPLEAPVLRTTGLRLTRTTVLGGLAGIRWKHGNRRVARQVAAIRAASDM